MFRYKGDKRRQRRRDNNVEGANGRMGLSCMSCHVCLELGVKAEL